MRSRTATIGVLALALAALATTAAAQVPRRDPTPHSSARLVAEQNAIVPGKPFTVGLRIVLDRGWHTYWINPGDAGTAATLDWQMPPGFVADTFQWPVPKRIPYPPLMSYAYEGVVLLPLEMTPPADLTPGTTAHLKADARWLVCQDECLVAEDTLVLDLPIAANARASRWADEFAKTRKLLPADAPAWHMEAGPVAGGLALGVTPPPSWGDDLDGAYFYPLDSQLLEHAAPQPLRQRGRETWLSLTRSPYRTELPARLQGVLALPPGKTLDAAGHVAVQVDVPLATDTVLTAAPVAAAPAGPGGAGGTSAGSAAPGAGGSVPVEGSGASASLSLLAALLFAFLGGMLLNLMPCVFPVLSLKVLGFVEHAAGDRRRMRWHGLAFGAGVVLSFLALAGGLMVVRAAGTDVGWGYQLQSPLIVTLLIFLMFAIGLNFLGMLEVGNSLTRLGGIAANDTGYRGSFLTGVLAVVVATPCTAPFMGAAVGTALVRPAAEGLAVFAGLGVGMAVPYMVLSSWPALLKRLPRPGRWMETLKQALAFPMFAVAVWLLWVLGLQTGMGGATRVLFALLLFAFGGWLYQRSRGARGQAGRVVARVAAVLALVGGLGWGMASAHLAGKEGASPPDAVGEDMAWTPFAPGVVAGFQAQGRPVFVDFTAAWCITCQVNERGVLSSARVTQAFRDNDVALVRADWTRRDADIARALASFGRSGVPLYVVYPADPGAAPTVLPTVLTDRLVLDALDRTTRKTARAGM
ncbi:MAG: thioredoxin family protein [Gemmatimonadota bacterium]